MKFEQPLDDQSLQPTERLLILPCCDILQGLLVLNLTGLPTSLNVELELHRKRFVGETLHGLLQCFPSSLEPAGSGGVSGVLSRA